MTAPRECPVCGGTGAYPVYGLLSHAYEFTIDCPAQCPAVDEIPTARVIDETVRALADGRRA